MLFCIYIYVNIECIIYHLYVHTHIYVYMHIYVIGSVSLVNPRPAILYDYWEKSVSVCEDLAITFCHRLDMKCPPKTRVLKAWSPMLCSEVELLGSDWIMRARTQSIHGWIHNLVAFGRR
jgi:hypothetical protein